MEDELHPLTELLLARLKSHPDEFLNSDTTRWNAACDAVRSHGNEADRTAWRTAVGRAKMDKAHEAALDELMNGEERRATEERMKYERVEAKRQSYLQQQQQVMQGYAQAQAQAVGLGQYRDATFMQASQMDSRLNIGGETLTGDTIRSIKKALGLK